MLNRFGVKRLRGVLLSLGPYICMHYWSSLRSWFSCVLKMALARTLLGRGAFGTPPPLRFFEASENTAALRAAGFSPTLPPSFPQLLSKFRPNAMWGQVTRSGQVTQLQNKFPIASRLQCFRKSYETFGIWWGHQCLQNIYLGFLISVTSGQVIFAASPL